MKITLTLLAALLFILISCNQQKASKDIIPDKQFIEFYADFLIVKEENTILSYDSIQARNRIDSIYSLHKVSSRQIDESRNEYNKDVAKWQSIYEQTLTRIDSLQEKAKQ